MPVRVRPPAPKIDKPCERFAVFFICAPKASAGTSRGFQTMLILFSNRTEPSDNRPSGHASLPDSFSFHRFAIGKISSPKPLAWGPVPRPLLRFALIGRFYLRIVSNRTGLSDNRPSGNASPPDSLSFHRFAIGARWGFHSPTPWIGGASGIARSDTCGATMRVPRFSLKTPSSPRATACFDQKNSIMGFFDNLQNPPLPRFARNRGGFFYCAF